MNIGHTVDGTGHVKQALCQSRLAAAAVAQQAYISNRVSCVHNSNLLSVGAMHHMKTLYTKPNYFSMSFFVKLQNCSKCRWTFVFLDKTYKNYQDFGQKSPATKVAGLCIIQILSTL